MESGGALVSANAPLTWNDFMDRMRHPSAADFVKSIRSFFVSFTNKVPNPESDSADVQEFFANMDKSFRAHSLWASCSDEELVSAGEGLEKYVMTKVFNRTFASILEEKKHDDELFEKMALVQQFIQPENLDISSTFRNENSWLLAQKELQKINMYKAPRDKLVCILNFCKVINNLLLNGSLSSNENPPGADEFLPVLIYVTIKANPPQLHSNLLYIQRYRCRSRLVSEAAYYFTNILSAESFIWNIDAKALSMNELEFQKKMESARAFLPVFLANTEGASSQSIRDIKFEFQDNRTDRMKTNKFTSEAGKDPSIANRQPISVSETQGDSNLLGEQELGRYFVEYPFLFASVGDLTIKDVETLLHCYKKIVLDYVSLSKGKRNVNPSFPSPFSEKTAQTNNNMDPTDGAKESVPHDKVDESRKAVENSTVTEKAVQIDHNTKLN